VKGWFSDNNTFDERCLAGLQQEVVIAGTGDFGMPAGRDVPGSPQM